MPAELKIAIAFNIIAIAVIAMIVTHVGNISDWGRSVELTMVPVQIEKRSVAHAAPAAQAPRTQFAGIPPEYQAPDLIPSPWVVLADGSIRFRDDGR